VSLSQQTKELKMKKKNKYWVGVSFDDYCIHYGEEPPDSYDLNFDDSFDTFAEAKKFVVISFQYDLQQTKLLLKEVRSLKKSEIGREE
jgi:hypothetical protein